MTRLWSITRWLRFRRWLAKRLWMLIWPTGAGLPEIRPNHGPKNQDTDDCDEVVGFGFFHVEQMDTNAYWARLDVPDGRAIVMWFNSKSKIRMSAEYD